ncbi:MAG: LutC/YkgG family protein [bacterium]
MNDSRDRILQRLRSARPVNVERSAAWQDVELFADYPSSTEQRLEHFIARIVSLRGEFFRARDVHEAAARLKGLLQTSLLRESLPPLRALRHACGLLDEVFQKEAWLAQNCFLTQSEMANFEVEQFEAGVTTADFLVARTGSIVLLAGNSGGRRLSVLPPFHIVVAKIEQLVDSLDEVFAALGKKDQNETSFMTIITGPSRTSDIEKTLVLGAHGPKRLAVILIG